MAKAQRLIENARLEQGIKPEDAARKPIVGSLDERFLKPDPVVEAARQAERERLNDEAEQRRRRVNWTDIVAHAVENYADAALNTWQTETPRQRSVLAAMHEYVYNLPQCRQDGNGILLFGPCGTGKDHLAMAVLRVAVLQYGYRCQRINGPEWYGKLRDMMDKESADEQSEIRRLSDCDFLLISDPLPPIGDLTSYQSAMLYRVMERRQSCGRPTIVTVNTTGAADAAKRMGEATVERMKYKAWVVECNWPSFRKPARVI